MEPDEWEKMSFISSLLWLFSAWLVFTFGPYSPRSGFEGGWIFVAISLMFSIPVVANMYRVYRSITLAGIGLFAGAAGITCIFGIIRGIIWLIKRQKQPVLRSAEPGKVEGEEDWEKEKSQAGA